ncbi:MAG: S8 family serine peptidase [Thiolinea sp.]
MQRLIPQATRGPAVRLQRAAPVLNARPSLQFVAPDVSDGYIVIDAVAGNDGGELEQQLLSLGMQDISRFGRIVSGRFPVSRLAELETVPVLRFARHALAIKNQGSALSQGDVAMRSDIARNAYEAYGAGVKIGVLSDSYNCLGGAAAGVLSGDLPDDVVVLQESVCGSPNFSNTDEGRGMLEIVHDIAPDAGLMFHSANYGQAGFANGIIALADAGAGVIVDDIRYLAEPMFQDGIIAQAVDKVHFEKDVTYFSSAGNDGRDAYERRYREERGSDLFDFANGGGPADVCLEVEVGPGRAVIPTLQWDDPFFSVSGGEGAKTDLAMGFFESCDPELAIGVTTFNNIGSDPVELALITNPTAASLTMGIVIQRIAGPEPGKIKLVSNGGSITDVNGTQSGTSYGHAVARGAMGVGASFFAETPAFFSDPALINPYSAAGDAKILFDGNGVRLRRPERRQQPAIVGPDGVDTTFFGAPGLNDGNLFPNFFGTSASAPHVAAVAALMRGHNPYADAPEIYRTLTRTAEDMDDPVTPVFDIGYDSGTGYGFVNADAALSTISPPASWYCDGKLATIIGTNLSETIQGTSGDDVIVGLNGNDEIYGKGGNDIICAGRGHDVVRSGAGDDKVFGGSGNDDIATGKGADEAYGENGRDRISGGANADKLFGGNGPDVLSGDRGRDLIEGGNGRDEAIGGAGVDDCTAEWVQSCE